MKRSESTKSWILSRSNSRKEASSDKPITVPSKVGFPSHPNDVYLSDCNPPQILHPLPGGQDPIENRRNPMLRWPQPAHPCVLDPVRLRGFVVFCELNIVDAAGKGIEAGREVDSESVSEENQDVP